MLLSVPVFSAKAATISRPSNSSGLVGYWNFEGAINGTVLDYSGYDNHAVASNTPVATSGKVGQAVDLENDDGDFYEGVSYNSSLDFTSDQYTVSGWIKPESSTLGIILAKPYYANDTHSFPYFDWAVHFDVNTSNSIGAYYTCSAPRQVYADSALTIGEWSHFAVTNDGNTFRFYLNGEPDGSSDITCDITNTNSAPFRIGANGAGGESFDGLIDELRAYNRALSAAEIKRLYQNTGPKLASGPSNEGLIGHWTFEDGQGLVAQDSSGQGNDGALEASMTDSDWVPGKRGTALDFDGSDDYVLANPLTGTSANTGSVAFWSYLNGPPTEAAAYISTGISGGVPNRVPEILISGGNLRTILGNTVGGGAYDFSTSYPTINTWVHIVVTWDTNSAIVYIDGQFASQDTTITGTIDGAASDLFIGADRDIAGRYLNVKMDDVRYYNRKLSADEVQNLYEETQTKYNVSPRNKLTDGLVGYYTFDGPDVYGTTVYDVSGSGNNGTSSGGLQATAGRIGQSFDFDGSNDEVILDNLTDFDFSQEDAFTVSMWAYNASTSPTAYQTFFSRGACASSVDTFVYCFTTTVADSTRIRAYLSDGTNLVNLPSSSGAFSLNQWNHIVYTWDGTTITAYVNDAIVIQNTPSPFNGLWDGDQALDRETSIGADGRVERYYYDGKLDEVRVYNRALSAREVLELYNMGR